MSDQDNFKGNPFAGADDGDNFQGNPFEQAQEPTSFKDAAKAHLKSMEANRQGFSGTPARMLKSTMQMMGAGNYVPDAVSRAAEVPEGGTVGRALGDVAGTSGIGAGAGAIVNALRAINTTRGVTPMVARLGTASGTTAGAAALTSPDDQANAAQFGAVAGPVGHVLGRAVGGVIKPTDSAKVLLDRGVPLTPGQAAGAGSFAGKLEESLASNPISGPLIGPARHRAVLDANRAASQSVVDLVDKNVKLGLPPRDAIEKTRDVVGDTYNKALEGMSIQGFVPEVFMRTVANRSAKDHPMLEAAQVDQMQRFITQRVGGMTQNTGGVLDGAMLKQLDSELGAHIRNLRSSTTAADKTAAPAWAEIQQSLREVMELAQGDPAKVQMLKAANTAYRQLLALEKALLDGAEHITPKQLARQLNKAEIKGSELNKISEAMTKTLPNTVGNSGTADRLIANALPAMLMGGGAGAQSMGFDTVGQGMLAAGALGTRTGSKLLMGASRTPNMLPYVGDAHWQPAAEATIKALRRGVRPNDE